MSERMQKDFPVSIDEQAAAWFSRRSGGGLSADEQHKLDAWLAADPAHERAFADLDLIWADFDQLERPALHRGNVTPLRPRKRWMPPALAASVVLVGALLALSQGVFMAKPTQELSLFSVPGEQKQVTLDDGTRIDLNVDTRLQVRLYEDRREVELIAGEAFFAVAPDAERPFDVIAGEGRVRVVGTRFGVRRSNEHLAVAVESGKVAVQPEAGHQQAMLGAGDGLDYDYRSGTLQQRRLGNEEIASWRQGQLIFRDRPLAQLLDELSHYRPAPVELADASLAERRVSGSVNIARPDAFLVALPQLLPVQVEYLAGGVAVVHAR